MRLIDMHCHWGTRRGYPLRSPAALDLQRSTWGSDPRYATEDEMAAYFRKNDVAVIMDLGFTKSLPADELRTYHEYAFEVQRQHSDVILGHWLQIDPRLGRIGVDEFRRLLDADCFVGLAVSGTAAGLPATDPLWEPFYEVCVETRAPVLILVGYTGTGAGAPGGDGMLLEHCHPRYVDQVAAAYPELPIVAGRPAWPWQAEMIAVMLHKRAVWNELHGWSPKYLDPALLHEVPRRLSTRMMFGSDYPLFTYERLVADWQGLGLSDDVLAKVFHHNARAFFDSTRTFRCTLD